VIWLALAAAVAAAPKPVKLELKAGQAIAFPVTIADGKVTVGAGRLGAYGKLEPAPGEIAVGVSPKGKDLYMTLDVVEKTPAPVDFLASGMIGEIKIDERDIHGRLDAPVRQRIGATSWTVWLNGFEAGAGK